MSPSKSSHECCTSPSWVHATLSTFHSSFILFYCFPTTLTHCVPLATKIWCHKRPSRAWLNRKIPYQYQSCPKSTPCWKIPCWKTRYYRPDLKILMYQIFRSRKYCQYYQSLDTCQNYLLIHSIFLYFHFPQLLIPLPHFPIGPKIPWRPWAWRGHYAWCFLMEGSVQGPCESSIILLQLGVYANDLVLQMFGINKAVILWPWFNLLPCDVFNVLGISRFTIGLNHKQIFHKAHKLGLVKKNTVNFSIFVRCGSTH